VRLNGNLEVASTVQETVFRARASSLGRSLTAWAQGKWALRRDRRCLLARAHGDAGKNKEAGVKRLPIVLVVAAFVVPFALIGPASAAPPNKTSLTLTCDREVATATAHLTLADAQRQTQAVLDLTCGSDLELRADRLTVTTAQRVSSADVVSFSVSTGIFTECAGRAP
jgi:hypothetical protein